MLMHKGFEIFLYLKARLYKRKKLLFIDVSSQKNDLHGSFFCGVRLLNMPARP